MAAIVVLGGGLAGLVAGLRLARAGHEVELLEAEPAVGGRLRPVATEEGLIERGFGEVGWGDANLRALIAGLGLESGSTRADARARAHALVLGGRLHRPPPLRLRELMWPRLAPRMDRPIDAVFRRPPRWGDRQLVLEALWDCAKPSTSETPRSLLALDDAAWSRASIRAFGTRWCTTRLAPSLLARAGVDLSAEAASVVLPILSRLLLGQDRSIAIRGGWPRLLEALAAPLRLRTGCRVESLETDARGVRVRTRSGGREGTVLADAAVLALAPGQILQLVPKLTPEERGHFEAMQARRSIVVYRRVSEPAWLFRGLAGVTFVTGELPGMRDLRMLGSPPPPYARDPFWIRISFEPEVVDDHWSDTDAALIRRVDNTFKNSPLGALPDGSSRVERFAELASIQGRGALRRRARFLRRVERTPRLVFATEALTTPDLEGRVTAGMRAARELAEELERSTRPGTRDAPGAKRGG